MGYVTTSEGRFQLGVNPLRLSRSDKVESWEDGSSLLTGGCDPGVNSIGYKDDPTAWADFWFLADRMYCQLLPADCSGTLGVAYIFHHHAESENVKICVYSEGDADTSPDADDPLLPGSQCVSVTGNADDTWYNSGANEVGGTVVNGTSYWLCIVADTGQWAGKSTTGGPSRWGIASSYATPPGTLTGTWTETADRKTSVYVTIK